MSNQRILVSPDCEVELQLTEDGTFLGLGNVTVHGVALRSHSRPIQFCLDTPTGILYTRLVLRDVEQGADGGPQIHLAAHGRQWPRGEFGDDYNQEVIWLADADVAVVDELTLVLKPEQLSLGGREWRGFSYSLSFTSPVRACHRLLVHGTWEIGGTVIGNTLLSQGQCNMPVYEGSADVVFTTACLKTLDQYGKPQGNSFQLGPRGGLVQGFDFQYAEPGVLLQYWPELDSVSSLIESPMGSKLMHMVDEYRFTLSSTFGTRPKHVLFSPGGPTPHDAHNIWWHARRHCYGLSRERFGIAPTVPVPEAGLKYSTRVADGRLRMNIGGDEVDSTEVPYAIAERVIPKLAAQGIKRFMPEVMSESDVTVDGMKRKLDGGVHGDLHCSSVCATHRFFPSDFWGGIKAWKVMADKAHELGMEIGAWFAPHFSPRAEVFKAHPEYRMLTAHSQPAGGGYGFQTLVVADWNTPIMDWVLADLQRWREEGGLDYLFTDSLSNLGLLQSNYAEDMRTNFTALGKLYARIQALGIRSFSCECISPWMASRFGVADLRGDLLEQDRAVAGQNDFAWWADHLEMSSGLTLMVPARKRTPEALEQFLFRAMASGGYLCYEHEYGIDHTLADWWCRLNQALTAAQPHMKERDVLPAGAGVCWTDGGTRTYWTFADLTVADGSRTDIEVLAGEGPTSAAGRGCVLPAWGVYRVR